MVAARGEFSVPLALLGPPGPHASLRAPAALALATTLATGDARAADGRLGRPGAIGGGRRASRASRRSSATAGVLGVASLVYDGSQDYIALGLVLLGGAVESVAAVVSKNAPKRTGRRLFDGREGRRLFFFFRRAPSPRQRVKGDAGIADERVEGDAIAATALTHASTQATSWSTSSLTPPQL